MAAAIAGIPLADVIDAYGSRTAVVRAMGYTRGPAGSQQFRDYRAAERALDRAASGQHATLSTRSGIGANLAAKLDPTWVMVNAGINRYKRANGGQPPTQVTIHGAFHVSSDERQRSVNLPIDDDADLRLLADDVNDFITDEFGQEAEVFPDDLHFS